MDKENFRMTWRVSRIKNPLEGYTMETIWSPRSPFIIVVVLFIILTLLTIINIRKILIVSQKCR